QLAQVERVQAVRVLGRVHAVQHPLRVEPLGQRQLDQEAGAGRIAVRVVPDQHRAQARRDAAPGQLGHPAGEVLPDRERYGLAVEDACGHRCPIRRVLWDRTDSARPGAMRRQPMALTNLEVISVPVSDQDRAKQFYAGQLGFSVEIDGSFGESMRWVMLRPPGSGTAITLVTWFDTMPAGSLKGSVLGCDDLEKTLAELTARG